VDTALERTHRLSRSLRLVGLSTFLMGLCSAWPVMSLFGGLLLWALLRTADHAPSMGRVWWLLSAAALSVSLAAAGFAHLAASPGMSSLALVALAAAWLCGALGCQRAAAWFGGAQRWQRVVIEVGVMAGLATYAAGWSASASASHAHAAGAGSPAPYGLRLDFPGWLGTLFLVAWAVAAIETWFAFGTLRAAVRAAVRHASVQDPVTHG